MLQVKQTTSHSLINGVMVNS